MRRGERAVCVPESRGFRASQKRAEPRNTLNTRKIHERSERADEGLTKSGSRGNRFRCGWNNDEAHHLADLVQQLQLGIGNDLSRGLRFLPFQYDYDSYLSAFDLAHDAVCSQDSGARQPKPLQTLETFIAARSGGGGHS